MLQAFLETEVPRIADGFTGALPAVLQDTPASSLVAIPGMDKPPHTLQHEAIVYIGDAWHPMTPFAGQLFLRIRENLLGVGNMGLQYQERRPLRLSEDSKQSRFCLKLA